MKKLTNIILLLTISVVGFSFTLITNPYPLAVAEKSVSLQKVEVVDCSTKIISTNGDRELRRLDDFNRIAISISGNIFYTQGDENKVEIDAQENVQENIITKVVKGNLIIKFKNKKDTKGDINIYITSKELEHISIAGSADFIAKEKVKSDEIIIEIAGSGDIIFNELDSKEVSINIAGSGDVSLRNKNKAEELDINIAGSGDVSAKSFDVDEAEINIAGSGDCIVNAHNELEVNIIGSGDVLYHGDPEIESNIIGSGEIRRNK